MRACYFHNDKEIGKVLIPGCYSAAHHYDIAFCTCDRTKNKRDLEDRVAVLEKKVKELEKIILQFQEKS